MEEKISLWQGLHDAASSLYNEANKDLYTAEVNIGVAVYSMNQALEGMQAALDESNSENYNYWMNIYNQWKKLKKEYETDKSDAQSRADDALTDLIRIRVVLNPMKKNLALHNTFTYNPLETERNRILSELTRLNELIEQLETYHANLQATAAALQAEIQKRNQASEN